MKIIDFYKKGNVVRFFLGDDNTNDYWGDDWDDRPYEHNAGEVYDQYVTGFADVAFPLEYIVLEPKDDFKFDRNSPYSKEDMMNRHAPCIVVYKPSDGDNNWLLEEDFSRVAAMKDSIKFYFGDHADPTDGLVVWTDDMKL